MKDHAEVCPLSRGMMLPCGAIPVRPITGWHSLFPHSVAPHRQQPSSRSACPDGQRYGFTVFRQIRTNGLDPASSPVVCLSVPPHKQEGGPHYVPIWARPISAFGLLTMTVFNGSSDILIMPSSLAPPPHRHSQRRLGLATQTRLTPGYIVPVASYNTVASVACTGRLRATERPVSFRRLRR
jgi:hypothetical protein